MNASPLKLKDGTWGAKLEGPAPSVGDKITVNARNGKSWGATVTAIVWSTPEGDVHYLRTKGDDPPTTKRSRRGSRSYSATIGDTDLYRNRNGRCEDAPCCGVL